MTVYEMFIVGFKTLMIVYETKCFLWIEDSYDGL